jgi:peptidoglycan/xylan/chitin deacetylase (PgdA/CDA1 family)
MLGSSGEPLWPDGHGFAVCLTHDVDLIATAATPRQALRSMRTSLAGDAATARDRVVRLARPGVRAARALHHGLARTPTAETLELCVETERERGVTATYFFTAYPGAAGHRYDCVYEFDDPCRFGGERLSVAEVIRRLHGEGFDVGLHGSYNSALSPGRLAQEKQELERVLGLEVATTRQHFIHWDVRTTPGLQAAAGFAADSTLGFNRNIGYRAGTSLPFRWLDLERNEPLDLLEVPLVVHDGALLRTDALELDLELARSVLRRMIDAAAETAAAVTLLFHPNNLERAEHLELYRFALDYGLERGGWFTSLRDLNHWWRDREARLR